MRIQVEVYKSSDLNPDELIASYVMEHDNITERRVLGEQCRNAFEGGQTVLTHPVAKIHKRN